MAAATGTQVEVEAPGVRLSVDVQGDGPPLVLVHGFGGDRSLWDEAWSALARRRKVVRYDLRGFGESTALEDAPFRHSRDLGALLDALGVGACDLAGVSMGGAIALNFTLDHPDRVRRLALISPGIVAWEWSDAWRAAWAPLVDAARNGDFARARELWWEHALFATTRASPGAAATLRRSIDAYSGRHWADGDGEDLALPDVDRLWSLNTPTLLLSGSEDLPDFRLIADLIEGAASDVRRLDYAGAGHMLHLERPGDFIADLEAFLSEAAAPR